MSENQPALNAEQFVKELNTYQSDEELVKYQRYFKFDKDQQREDDYFIGVRMGQVFALAKAFIDMPLVEIEKLLESPIHEVRVGAVSIMDWQARSKTTPEERRKALFDLYLRRHDRINNWDLVDRAAPHVIGRYLVDKPRHVLYELARSDNVWKRRTAVISTGYFIRQGDVVDAFQIAAILGHDEHDLVHKATGWMLREAGKKEPDRLLHFLEQQAATMPRTMLRYAMEHLDKAERDYYRSLKKENEQ
jgi:3-methyladenine DNA glycosylase AlkD